jgi:hypothetical protein
MEEHMETLDLDSVDKESSKKGSKFVEPASDDDFEVEVVDDTPEEDRGRKPMETPPEEPTDEELATYSKRDRNRIREFTKGYHEERRAKEAALREREEAIRLAQSYFEENKRLKGTVHTSNNALIEQAKIAIAQELNEAKRKYKQAYEEGDPDALVAAQEELTSVKLKAERVNNFKPKPIEAEEEKFVPAAQPTQAPPVDWKAEKWRDENKDWFGVDREMTGFAFAVHDKLVNEERLDPTSDEYYKRLNGRLRQVFADRFESDEPADAPTQRPAKSNVVASATRSVAPKKIMLTQSEVNIAKRLGVPLEQYAREVARLRRNGNG